MSSNFEITVRGESWSIRAVTVKANVESRGGLQFVIDVLRMVKSVWTASDAEAVAVEADEEEPI